MSGDITIVCVPPQHFARVWLHCGDLVRDAVRTAGNMGDVVERIEDANLQLWLVLAPGYGPVAACFTDINIEEPAPAQAGDGGRFTGIYGLNGVGVRRWARPLAERLVEFATAERCSRVMFRGRKAWGRVLPEFRPVRQDGAETIYERAAS